MSVYLSICLSISVSVSVSLSLRLPPFLLLSLFLRDSICLSLYHSASFSMCVFGVCVCVSGELCV